VTEDERAPNPSGVTDNWRESVDFPINEKTFFPMYLRDFTLNYSGREYEYNHEKDIVIKRNLRDIRRITCNGTENSIIKNYNRGSSMQNRNSFIIADTFRRITDKTVDLPLGVCRALIHEHIESDIRISPQESNINPHLDIYSFNFTVVDLYLAYLGNTLICLCNAAVDSAERAYQAQREDSYYTQRVSIVATRLYFNDNGLPEHSRPITGGDPENPFHIDGFELDDIDEEYD
jgi:hypothetical protein